LGDGIVIRTGKLNHPNGACGYRIEYGGKVLSICTDTEHYEGKLDENILALADQADAMIYDSAYTEEEYEKFKGWGHSTWQEALKIADAANVKNTFLFHHDPSHNDDKMDEIAREAAAINSSARPAIEGEEIIL
jgi:phosphoribosyl 1,2-cyclic phosphodiesterase